MPKSIKSIKVETPIDENPDTSWMGVYLDKFEYDEGLIITQGRYEGEFLDDLTEEQMDDAWEYRDRRKFMFFKPEAGGLKFTAPDFRKYAQQDYKRMRELELGYWTFIGVKAYALYVSSHGIVQSIASSGVWGVESDGGDDLLMEIAREELDQLREELYDLGFSEKQVQDAMEDVEYTGFLS